MESEKETELSPLMKQYWDLKAQAGSALMLFRMGDFYELFADDAIEASRILQITLTSRDKNKENPTPMAGVPHHSVQGYIQKLLQAGKKVAIADQMPDQMPDQMEDPGAAKGIAKGIVRREIVRVFTPAIQFDLEGSETNFIATAIYSRTKEGSNWALCCLDASTGETRSGVMDSQEALIDEALRLPIRHWVQMADTLSKETIEEISRKPQLLFEELSSNFITSDRAEEVLKAQFQIATVDTFLPTPAETQALGLLVHYAARTQKIETLPHLRLPRPLHQAKSLVFGPRTPQHLNLFPSEDGSPNLFEMINLTRSSMGSRQLRRWLSEPLTEPSAIRLRQESVRELKDKKLELEELSRKLAEIYDIERILGRVTTGLASPIDTIALGKTLSASRRILPLLSKLSAKEATRLNKLLSAQIESLRALEERILSTQIDPAPALSRDAGIFKLGTTPELDRLISLTDNGQRWLVDLETREREVTGIPSLKVRYNRVFGYYIEITSTHLKNVPAHYQRKQTMVGAERFFTEELKKFEEEILTSSSRQKALEQALFQQLIADIRAVTKPLNQVAQAISELDSLCALARLALEPGWNFPEIDDSLSVSIEGGRHPLVDQSLRNSFVPNGLELSPETRLTLIITGPNMGGKSTVMRQVALIAILGQMGAPVPATKARWGSFSSVHTRIGAHDAIARGQSTFMVEMSELAHILHNADKRALIVLDEIGRGTSTYDGISVAWATLEWICSKIEARTLFATHYHELTRLASRLPRVANAHMAVDGDRGAKKSASSSLRFLYELREGASSDSFGIQVAKLAGLPLPVIQRAWKVLEDLEQGTIGGSEQDPNQLSLFNGATASTNTSSTDTASENISGLLPLQKELLLKIQEADIENLTPVQALNVLAQLRENARELG